MQHEPDRADHLTGERAVVEPRERAERLEPRGHVVEAVRVERARAAVVPGVEGGEQLAHLLAAALADDEPVRPHPQRLAHQPGEPDRAGALEVRLPGLERARGAGWSMRSSATSSIVTMRSPAGARPSSAASSVVLPVPAAPVTRRFSRARDGVARAARASPASNMPRSSSVGERDSPSRGTRIEIDGALGCDRRQHGVHADAALEPHVDARRRIVDVPIAERR